MQTCKWKSRPDIPALLSTLRHFPGWRDGTPLRLPDWRPPGAAAAPVQLTDRSSLPHVAAASLSGVPCAAAMCNGSAPLPHSSGAAPPSREPMKAPPARDASGGCLQGEAESSGTTG